MPETDLELIQAGTEWTLEVTRDGVKLYGYATDAVSADTYKFGLKNGKLTHSSKIRDAVPQDIRDKMLMLLLKHAAAVN